MLHCWSSAVLHLFSHSIVSPPWFLLCAYRNCVRFSFLSGFVSLSVLISNQLYLFLLWTRITYFSRNSYFVENPLRPRMVLLAVDSSGSISKFLCKFGVLLLLTILLLLDMRHLSHTVVLSLSLSSHHHPPVVRLPAPRLSPLALATLLTLLV